ncbi:hypothetical protein A9179_20135 [Pseudomonas alcaligenes]|uniref:Transport permease protein n=1 Tax=Aquipseudomonas alcaligenes TaxID=43263 RepID=A0ABR7S4S5_AQUAC|nr:ABC transporter permease [Pseudomonas alcaligenes]MBC9252580.1 hypothetical protein [Pseudomonas alcaligenes]
MLFTFTKDLYKLRNIILELVKRDYQQQNQGSYLGFIWNYLQPLLFVSVLYGVIAFGFRHTPNNTEIPFGLYLLSGMTCWLYFSSNLISITGVIRSYSFLVKKIEFRLSILPLVKLLSSLPPHAVLVTLMLLLAHFNGFTLGLHNLQLLYYYLCMAVFLMGFGWITSAASLFVRDITNGIAVITQFGLWLTPIFWNAQTLPEQHQWLLRLNPANYLVTGYRDSLSGGHYFWERPEDMLAYWAITAITLVIGAITFKRLKPHFAEVI